VTILKTCCKWQITRYFFNGEAWHLQAETAKISGHKFFPDGWYLVVGEPESPAWHCIRCGKSAEELDGEMRMKRAN